LVPLLGYIYITFYALSGSKIKGNKAEMIPVLTKI